MRCLPCDRVMQGQHSHGDAYYRCRYPKEYAAANKIAHPANVYLKEEPLIRPLDSWLASSFAPSRRATTVEAMFEAQPEPTEDANLAHLKQVIAEADAKIGRYQAAADAGADPVVIAGWINSALAEKAAAQAQLRPAETRKPRRMSREEITDLVNRLGDILQTLAEADPDDKAEIYKAVGLRLRYDPARLVVKAEVSPTRKGRGAMGGVEGGT